MASTARIVETAMLLRAVAPDLWEQFVLAMREYAAATTSEMVRCPPEMLPRAQGMAITANDLAVTLVSAHKLKDRPHGQGIQTGPVSY